MVVRFFLGLLLFFVWAGFPQNDIALGQNPNLSLLEIGTELRNEFYSSPTQHSLGVVWFDANGDNYPDVLATNGYSILENPNHRPHLYLNDQNGDFVLRDDLLPDLPNLDYVGALAADYDRDGDTDLFIYTANENFSIFPEFTNPLDGPKNLLLKNLFVENGHVVAPNMFVDVAEQANLNDCLPEAIQQLDPDASYEGFQTRSAAFLDYDLDGWIDLYVGHMAMNRSGSTSDPMLDEVGKLANMDVIYRNEGDGTFTLNTNVIQAGNATNRCALVVVAGHLNDDRWPDVYVGNVGNDPVELLDSDTHDTVLINDGHGHLVQSHQNIGHDTPGAMGVDFADVNFDGAFDIYISDVPTHYADGANNAGNTFYLSDGLGGFRQNSAIQSGISFGMSWGVNFADFDLDGREDLFVGSASVFPSTVFSKTPEASLLQNNLFTSNVRGSAIADFDRDGDPDLLLVNESVGLQLFRNNSADTATKSFVVELQTTISNKDAIGARVILQLSNGVKLVRQIKGGTSSHSQDYGEAYFGIGNQTIRAVEVIWPHRNGTVSRIGEPTGNRIVVVEP